MELTIGPKSGVHYQSLLPLEINVSRSKMKPSSPEVTIELKLAVTTVPGQMKNCGISQKLI